MQCVCVLSVTDSSSLCIPPCGQMWLQRPRSASSQKHPKQAGRRTFFLWQSGKKMFPEASSRLSHMSHWPDWATCSPLDQWTGCLPFAPQIHILLFNTLCRLVKPTCKDFRIPVYLDGLSQWGVPAQGLRERRQWWGEGKEPPDFLLAWPQAGWGLWHKVNAPVKDCPDLTLS